MSTWYAKRTAGDHGFNIYDEASGNLVAHVYGEDAGPFAILIAAAPELLSALEEIADLQGGGNVLASPAVILDIAHDAVAAAREEVPA